MNNNQRFLKYCTSLSPRSFFVSVFGFGFLLANQAVFAACKGINCICKPAEIQYQSPTLAPDENGEYPISLEADNVESQGKDVVTLTGNAEVSQGRQTIVADLLKYYRETDRVVAEGNIEMISENGDYLASDFIDVHAPTQIGTVKGAEFKLAQSLTSQDGVDTVAIMGRGSADVIDLEGEGKLSLEGATYTACNEGDDVLVSAKHLELDQNAGMATARGATIKFLGLPIFYAPYLTFPINDQRKTGFLTPGFGSDDESGFILDTPWYWNIAPNQDATFTPRYFENRGPQLGVEYRHRSASSNTYFYGEYMASDDLYEDKSRDMFSIRHYQQFTDNLTGLINYNDVSDVDYFDDFRNNPYYFSATYVPRDVTVNYSSTYFNVKARANQYQIIDPIIPESRKPYERLPSIYFSTKLPEGPMGTKFSFSGSYTNYSSDTRIEGSRISLYSSAMLPIESIWGYVHPRVSVYHRRYNLDNVPETSQIIADGSYTAPIFSVDSGIYLEKNINWFGKGSLQTLEPRVFYVYAPEKEQKFFKVFDTSQVSLNNFSNIFRENRFYGGDRVGDTNQITFGLTSKIIDNKTGDQKLKASIGQLYLIDDLKQNLDPNQVIESGLGDLLGEISTQSDNGWTTYGFMQYDHDESELKTARFAFGYRPKDDNRKNVSIGYYYANGFDRRADVDQLTVDMNWPVSDRWQFFGSERYSLEKSESISTMLGLEYNACCWKVRFTGHERINNRDINDKKTSFFIELELTNLGSIRTGLK